uniref:Uncharacterized protein n=1 Tax=Chromera velia CCMP2878 TaxID=1169474 RepID=A0A0G4I1H2_9ALVE|eukprot:Cvel_10113.t1-p1 / transcript=Cvel_10113.t1 / gene=Cvel_10113 / organism=Chromera_velia_CCMP2878 / gene_product=hypothetical protein / transcript_product=hypothetical protein / location=Cvel_scaffold602:67973-75187(-) / protein_length=1000 / sequence_SO=supercontig / SO=protein_coding / is_pseudo=false
MAQSNNRKNSKDSPASTPRYFTNDLRVEVKPKPLGLVDEFAHPAVCQCSQCALSSSILKAADEKPSPALGAISSLRVRRKGRAPTVNRNVSANVSVSSASFKENENSGGAKDFRWLLTRLTIPQKVSRETCKVHIPETAVFIKGKPRALFYSSPEGYMKVTNQAQHVQLPELTKALFRVVRRRQRILARTVNGGSLFAEGGGQNPTSMSSDSEGNPLSSDGEGGGKPSFRKQNSVRVATEKSKSPFRFKFSKYGRKLPEKTPEELEEEERLEKLQRRLRGEALGPTEGAREHAGRGRTFVEVLYKEAEMERKERYGLIIRKKKKKEFEDESLETNTSWWLNKENRLQTAATLHFEDGAVRSLGPLDLIGLGTKGRAKQQSAGGVDDVDWAKVTVMQAVFWTPETAKVFTYDFDLYREENCRIVGPTHPGQVSQSGNETERGEGGQSDGEREKERRAAPGQEHAIASAKALSLTSAPTGLFGTGAAAVDGGAALIEGEEDAFSKRLSKARQKRQELLVARAAVDRTPGVLNSHLVAACGRQIVKGTFEFVRYFEPQGFFESCTGCHNEKTFKKMKERMDHHYTNLKAQHGIDELLHKHYQAAGIHVPVLEETDVSQLKKHFDTKENEAPYDPYLSGIPPQTMPISAFSAAAAAAGGGTETTPVGAATGTGTNLSQSQAPPASLQGVSSGALAEGEGAAAGESPQGDRERVPVVSFDSAVPPGGGGKSSSAGPRGMSSSLGATTSLPSLSQHPPIAHGLGDGRDAEALAEGGAGGQEGRKTAAPLSRSATRSGMIGVRSGDASSSGPVSSDGIHWGSGWVRKPTRLESLKLKEPVSLAPPASDTGRIARSVPRWRKMDTRMHTEVAAWMKEGFHTLKLKSPERFVRTVEVPFSFYEPSVPSPAEGVHFQLIPCSQMQQQQLSSKGNSLTSQHRSATQGFGGGPVTAQSQGGKSSLQSSKEEPPRIVRAFSLDRLGLFRKTAAAVCSEDALSPEVTATPVLEI